MANLLAGSRARACTDLLFCNFSGQLILAFLRLELLPCRLIVIHAGLDGRLGQFLCGSLIQANEYKHRPIGSNDAPEDLGALQRLVGDLLGN